MNGQLPPTLGGLQGVDVSSPHQPWEVPWFPASWSRGDLVIDAGEVRASGDRIRGQRSLQDGATLKGVGGRYWGSYPRGADPVRETLPGGGLGVSPHWCVQCVQWGEQHRHDMGSAPRVAQWCKVRIKLIPPQGHTGEQVGRQDR